MAISSSRRFLIAVAGFILSPLTMTMQQQQQQQQRATEAGGRDRRILFDFTKMNNVDDWMEISDTVREVGMSKAVITLQKTQIFQRAIFFALLNPQSNGAGFAGVRTRTDFNLVGYDKIEISCRSQGNNENYKVVLRHRGLSDNSDISYEQFFTAPNGSSTSDFTTISLELSNFQAYYRGRPIPDAEPLDVSNITMFGLQVYGGVYSPFKQSGVSSLEINSIVASIR